MKYMAQNLELLHNSRRSNKTLKLLLRLCFLLPTKTQPMKSELIWSRKVSIFTLVITRS